LIAPSRITFLSQTIATLAISAPSFHGECFRCVSPKRSGAVDIFSGMGSKYASGRYHAKGKFTAVYASMQVQWAYDEYRNTARNNGVSESDLLPVTLAAARLKLSKVLDLTDPIIQSILQVTPHELIHSKWTSKSEAITQLIGRLANAAGYDGIKAPSAGSRTNIIILLDNVTDASAIDIVNADRLPRNP
jgi:RES domain-containing protein